MLTGFRPTDSRAGFPPHRLWSLLVILFGVTAPPTFGQMPTTMLSSVFPPSGKPGTDVEVSITGENLDEVSALQFSHPGITAAPKMSEPDALFPEPLPIENQFIVKIAGEVPPGIYEVRTLGRYGISNPRAFVVDDLSQMLRETLPDTKEKAIAVPVGSAVVATMTAQRIEYYQTELKKGDRVLIDCWCERIDSRMDPVIMLYDANGRLARRARQVEPRDSLIQWEAKVDGPHLIAVHDFTYRGGAEYAYRLAVRNAPYIDFIFPPVGQPGSKETYTVYGRNLPSGQSAGDFKVRGVPLEKTTVQIALPSDPKSLNSLPMGGTVNSYQAATSGFAYRIQGPSGTSNPETIHFADAPIVIEQEPANNTKESPQKIQVPCEYIGQFYPARDRDWVSFEAKKGEVYWINVLSQRLGTPADPVLMIERITKDAKGVEQVKMVTRLDDMPYTPPGNNQTEIVSLKTDDPKYRLEADLDATYRIRLNDLYNNPANDPRLTYRLVIQKENPDFQLVAYVEPHMDNRRQMKPTSCVVRRGGTRAVKLNLARQYGFDGEITVSVEGLPKTVTCKDAVFSGQVDEGWLVFEGAENAPAWAGPIRIVGRAKLGDKDVEREARYGTLLWPLVQNTPVSSRLARNMTLSVIDAETAPATLQAGEGKLLETSLGAKLNIPLKVVTREKLKGDLKVSAVNLPRDITRKDETVKDSGKTEFFFRSTNIPTGTYTFYFQGVSKLSYKRNQDAITKAKDEKKRADEMKKKFADAVAAAKTKAAEAAKAAQTTANQLKAAQQASAVAAKQDDAAKKTAAENALKEAQTKDEMAQAAKKAADEALAQATEMQKKADAYAKKADTDLKTVTNANKTADINLYVVSTPVTMKVHPHPLGITVPTPGEKLLAEKSLELPIKIERKFGFADKVDVELVAPTGVKGLSGSRVSLDKNTTDAKMTLKAAKDITPGSHEAILRFRLRFNNVSLTAEQPVIIEAVAPKEVATK